MICGASIAKRDGTHRRCLRRPDHSGDCSPIALAPPISREENLAIGGVHMLLVLVVVLVCCLGCSDEGLAKVNDVSALIFGGLFVLIYTVTIGWAIRSWLRGRR